jgi:ligand-binding sensor domain-containing protein
MKNSYIIVFFLFVMGSFNLNAQKTNSFTNFTVANSGIPNDMVSAVTVDNNNNVWVGTDGGVAKFDGTNWTVYNSSNSGFPNDFIISIAYDKTNNTIWAGTDGDGVMKYDGSTWTNYKTTDGLCDNAIHYITVSDDGYVWFGSWGSGVTKLKLSGMTWTTYSAELPNDGAPASIYYIYVDASNLTWFATNLGLVYYNGSTFATVDTTGSTGNSNTSFAVDGSNNRWAGVELKGVDKLNSSNTFVANYDKDNGLDDNGVHDIKFDSQGNLWIGEFTSYGPSVVVGGLTKLNTTTGSGITYSSTDGLNSEFVYKIAVDANDNIWLATAGGLSKFTNPNGIDESYKNGLLDIYPNPAHDYLTLNSSMLSGTAVISDITGHTVLCQTIHSSAKINVGSLVDGIYFIRIITEENNMFNGKFIIE